MKRIIGIIVGFILGIIIVSGGHMLSTLNYPPPSDLIIHDKEALRNYIQNMPNSAVSFVILSHFLGSFFGSFVSAKISNDYKFYIGLFVGSLFIIATIANNLNMPHSLNFGILDISLTVIAAYFGARMGSKNGINSEL